MGAKGAGMGLTKVYQIVKGMLGGEIAFEDSVDFGIKLLAPLLIVSIGFLGDRKDREYFKKAIQGELNYSDVIISGSTNKPIVVLAMPLKKGNGVIGASIDLSGLYGLLSGYEDGRGSYGFIVERNGLTIAHKNEEYIEEMLDATFLEPV